MWRDMWRKKDRMAGGRLPGCKERGEWAELYFMMQAAGRALKVSRPFSWVGRYDVGVENPQVGHQAQVLRVQVKSTIYKRRHGEYSLNVLGPKRKKYEPGVLDFFAILLIPVDEWYIIPFEAMGRTNTSIHITPDGMRQKYGRYREAWHLLRESGLTIQACVDPEWPEVGEELVVAEPDTKIPRFARNNNAPGSRNDDALGSRAGLRSEVGVEEIGGAGRNRTDA
ncbi:MAG TPA: group I intron-associated PD-(D/E)XK endonuclease [Candidatus Acidoferrum sp.]|jgi:hypothetical protein|nr:group I intron-associated PD-(D/E)XK endonuclease [Candidatus Acidoferrum sp.]